MKTYTTRDESAGYVSAENMGLSLLAVIHITDWTEEEFDVISELEVGEKMNSQGITCERTA